jgi:DNA invertase Pin-like site-specific DNA recombinase
VVAAGSTLRISASASYVDRTASAHGCTDGFTRLARDAEDKRFDVLVVVDIDRLAQRSS